MQTGSVADYLEKFEMLKALLCKNLAAELLLHVLMEDQSQKNQQALPFSYTTCLLRIAKYQSEDFVWKPGTLFDILEDKDCCEGEVL